MWQDANIRNQFCELLDYMANTHTADSIDWDHLPKQFALEGQNIRFDLGVDKSGGVYSDVTDDMVDVLFSKDFKRWMKQKVSTEGNTIFLMEAVYTTYLLTRCSLKSYHSFKGM